MPTVWQVLIGNFAAVALVISLWMHFTYRYYRLSKAQLRVGFGLTMGFCIVVSMMLSVQLIEGLFFDLRVSLLVIATLFGGPVSAAIAGGLAVICRCMMGGAGMVTGLIGIGLTLSVGLLAYTIAARFLRRPPGLYLLATLVSILSIALLRMLPDELFLSIVSRAAVPIILLNFFAVLVGGFVIGYFAEFTLERDILHAALAQAPDFHYVKNLSSRFVVTNINVARHNGRQKSSDMVGMSDFDIAPAERAAALFEAEQQIIASGEAMIDNEEEIVDEAGNQRWFTTSKVPLRNRRGETIGLAGVTRDITHRKALEQQLVSSRNLLSQAMAEMSDGLAMFDQSGHLVFCNDQYQAFFPRSSYARKPGAHISEIIRAAVRNGERKDVSSNASEEWIQNAAKTLHQNKDEDVPLFDDRWLSIRTRVAQDGASLVVVSDITAIKSSEEALRRLADQMKGLAQTDGLTGLANRRTFDEVIALECARAVRTGAPLTLMLVDVDRFKAFNDTYGHPAGDACLKAISVCLLKIAKRTSDVAARYGGEEFAIILPETHIDDALVLAENFRNYLAERAIVHSGSEFGFVTASIGVASMAGSNPFLNPSELVNRADALLYQAKQGGRNRFEFASAS